MLDDAAQDHGAFPFPDSASRLVRTSRLITRVEIAELMLAMRSLSRATSVGSERKLAAALSISCCVRPVVHS